MLPETVAATLGLCLAAMSGPGIEPARARFLPVTRFTLAWTHSRERTRWEEDYRITLPDHRTGSLQLQFIESRVKGSGAGIDPGPTAQLERGWYRDRAPRAPLDELLLARSEHVADFELCVDAAAGKTGSTKSRCHRLGDFLPQCARAAVHSVSLRPCQR